jgi:8-oxo-dGTP pyrophosphatase MutT (NUDIX family)
MKDRATVLCVRDNRILLVARERSRWALPGGRIRRGEAPHEAALRELEEETTLVANELMYLFQFGGFNPLHYVFFAGVVLVGDASATSDPSWGCGLSLTLRDVRVLRDCGWDSSKRDGIRQTRWSGCSPIFRA